ncbi:MAG: hypothetical protein KH326_01835 [Ruminococcus callidus]|uniref:hypothetical protein n=1 Tax=Ruminococcus callidus TaxID=40519 RepID=UPI0023F0CC4C|nr:hypothetical protein [Ruminococcus callidus]MBS6595792.1 hypothetical protein [Ruminococcus callidus]
MSKIKCDYNVVSECITKMMALTNKNPSEITFETQNIGDMANRIKEIDTQLVTLQKLVNKLILNTAIVTKKTMDSLVELDDDFAEILEQ